MERNMTVTELVEVKAGDILLRYAELPPVAYAHQLSRVWSSRPFAADNALLFLIAALAILAHAEPTPLELHDAAELVTIAETLAVFA